MPYKGLQGNAFCLQKVLRSWGESLNARPMGKPRVGAAGGLAAVLYTLRKGAEVGRLRDLYRRLRTKNACKTCALGMGGQKGGMVNELGHFPEVCKKSMQAQSADWQGAISPTLFETTPIAVFSKFTPKQLEDLGRLSYPLIAEPGDKYFRRIPWEDALDRAGKGIAAVDPRRFFLYVSGRSGNEAGFLAQLVARAYGSNNIHNCSYFCHQASGVALNKVYGSGTASVVLDDVQQADLAVVIGANPASNHPRLISQLVNLRRRGGRVIVINPLRELGLTRFRIPSDWRSLLFGSNVADLYLQPRIGSDIALLTLLLKDLIEIGGIDRDFIDNHTEGWQAVEKQLAAFSRRQLLDACGLAPEEVARAVEILFGAKRGIMMWAMGLTHHTHGVENILALANLALAKGWLGRPGAGMLPLRGHSNVQGIGSVGVTPALKKSFADHLAKRYGIQTPKDSGQDTYASLLAASRGTIDAALLFGGNLLGSSPDARWTAEALQKVGLTVHISTKLNTGHVQAPGRTTLILPALVRDEEEQRTTQESMFNYVRISDGGSRLVEGEMRSEVDIIASLAERILPEGLFDWRRLRSHDALRKMIADAVPGYGAIAQVDPEGGDQEFQIAGRTFHGPHFATADGKARFHPVAVPRPQNAEVFQLMTLRSEGQFNTVVYENEDLYRGVPYRDAVLMCAADAQRLGLVENDRVVVETAAGRMDARVFLTDIAAGCLAMYFPEANVLVPRDLDPQSKTPAFKSVAAKVYLPEARAARPPALEMAG